MDTPAALPTDDELHALAERVGAKLQDRHLMLATAEVNAHLEKTVEDGLVGREDGRFWAK